MIKAVIFDWAGTTIDYGCFAPIKGFLDGFKSIGVDITNEMARKPMGLLKIDHTRAIAASLDKPLSEEDILKAYSVFEATLFANITSHCDVKEYVLETVSALRKRNIKIGSTTGYTDEMMKKVLVLSAQNGYLPDFSIASDKVAAGRPAPYMIRENLAHFGVDDPGQAVKVGDTVADIEEGKNAGCWTVGVVMGSSELGLTKKEVDALPKAVLEEQKLEVRKVFQKVGADYIIDDMRELLWVIDHIEEKQGENGKATC